MSIEEKAERYARLMVEASKLEAEIKAELLKGAQSRKLPFLVATYRKPGGSTDYKAAALAAGADDGVIKDYLKVSVSIDWKGLCDSQEYPVKRFYTEGTGAGSVSLKIDEAAVLRAAQPVTVSAGADSPVNVEVPF